MAVFTGTADRPAKAAPSCTDLFVLGARGSGERGPGSPGGWEPDPKDPRGLGSTVLSAYRQIKNAVQGRRLVTAASVTYPAEAIAWSKDFLLKPDEYFNGLSTGVNSAVSTLNKRAGDCPTERIVLIGYSQGGMVMHRVLRHLQISPTGRAVLARIDAALLIADGDRVANDNTKRIGSMHPQRKGIGLFWRAQSGSGTTKFPSDVGDRVFEVCNRDDPVCDAPGVRLLTHTNYPNGPELADASKRVGQRVLARPKPTPDTVRLNVKAGTAVRHQLTADVAGGYTLTWSLVPPAAMPAGLTLSRKGVISGTPLRAVTGSTPIRVRAERSGDVGQWVPATLLWSTLSTNPQLTVTPGSGPAGSRPLVRSVDPCPTTGGTHPQVVVSMGVDWKAGSIRMNVAADGSWAANPWTGTTDAPATWQVRALCLLDVNGVETTVQTYEPKPFVLDAPAAQVTVSPSTVSVDGTVTVTSDTPCPSGDPHLRVIVGIQEVTDPMGAKAGHVIAITPVDKTGRWTATASLADVVPDLPPATYRLFVNCHAGDFPSAELTYGDQTLVAVNG